MDTEDEEPLNTCEALDTLGTHSTIEHFGQPYLHGERLARSSLSVGEYRAVIALHHLLDQGLHHGPVHLGLRALRAKDLVELESLGQAGVGLLLYRDFPAQCIS